MQKKKVYTVATAHLDTVWRWDLAKTINEYIPDTIEKNFELIEKYPNYRFNFEGAFRYDLIEEYYPLAFSRMKQYIKERRWCPAGSCWENGDVNIPSPEALFRNILLGNGYFKENFGIKTKDIFLPDCFGFGYALPSVMKHAGLNGFITQKLSWGSAYGVPFDIGYWQGVDGSRVFACLDARSYRYKFNGDVRADSGILDKLKKNAFNCNLPQTLNLYGTGDVGGAPDEATVENVDSSVMKNENTDFEIISAAADEMFSDLEQLDNEAKKQLPVWNNELLMTSHGAGGYTSRAMSKRLNRKNELLADTAEKALSLADMLGVYTYPKKTLNTAWKRVIRHQFHDDLPGTSNMDVYNESWNDYALSLSQFKNEYTGAVGAVANELDTSFVTGCAVIVNNPVAIKRKDAVMANVRLSHNGAFVKVMDKNCNEVPSQVISKKGKDFTIVFLAEVDSLGYKVYDVQASNCACDIKTDLRVSKHSLESDKYRLMFNKNGDIASIIDKRLNIQLLESPIKMALLKDTGGLDYPSWEMRKEDIDKDPYCYANTPEFEIVENGPARIAVKVTRKAECSTIIQTVSLSSGSEFIRVENFVDWQSRRTMLKAMFPFSFNNETATYDLGLGVIERKTNSESLYEVPAQKWADITKEDGEYGVTVFSDSKYGWDKPNNNTLRLTCIHTPAGAFIKEARQDLQEIGRNLFGFGLFSHTDSYKNGSQIQSELFSQPLTAFQTTARKSGTLTDSFSTCTISNENVLLRCLKKSEDSSGYVVRFNESIGKSAKRVIFSLYEDIQSAKEILADEEVIGPAKLSGGKLIFDLKPFEVKSFLIKMSPHDKNGNENYKKLELPYNVHGITSDSDMRNVILQGSGCSLPAEIIPDKLTVGGITFRMPKETSDEYDLLVSRGQTISLPKGFTKLYFLAASTSGERENTFLVDTKERNLTVHAMSEPVFTWDMAGIAQSANVKNANLGLEFTHCHHPEGNMANKRAYFFLYELDVRNAKALTLPEDNHIIIAAMTAVKKFSNTYLSTPLLDSAKIGYQFGDIPPIDKIIDKADFITIRAGKIHDQTKGGKGKGLKRDNPITNIIRSYTKSEW